MRVHRISAGYFSSLLLAVASLIAGTFSIARLTEPVLAQTTTPSWTLTGSLNTNRFEHTATLLPNGKVLIVGGGGFPCSGNFCYSTVNGSAELYDPATGVWSYAGNPSRRAAHTATLLQNGQVLVAGGHNYGYDIGRFEYVTSAELYDPITGSWRPAAGFNRIVAYHTATLLPNGKVLAVGNSNPNIRPVSYYAELFDPANGTWSNINDPGVNNIGSLTLLPNGKVLHVADSAELYDPATGQWSSAGTLNVIRWVSTATLLLNGKVLVIGDDGPAPVAELYDPATGAWSSTGAPSQGGTVTLLADGRVLIAGGADASGSAAGGTAELYDPSTGSWSPTGQLNTARSSHTATLLPNGRVLVAGGIGGEFYDFPIHHDSAELYAPAPNAIDDAQFFVRQQYLDFLGREPDTTGFQNWVNTLAGCPNGGHGEFDNPYCDRVHVSAGFVQSHEFQGRGYWILRFAYVGLNRSIGSVRSSATYAEFTPALAQVGGSNSPAQEEAAKVVYANAFVQRADFLALFPPSMTASQFVNTLETNAQVTLPNKQALIDALNAGTMSRADVLRNVVESQIVFDKYLIPAFVTMEYFGYLRRDPDLIGYQNWVNTLTADPNNYRHMIFGFIYSTEYRQRFGAP